MNEFRAGAESAKGLREENQDAMTRFQSRFGEVILVADGMGGHQGGAVASDMVAKGFRAHLDSMPDGMPLADALQQAAVRVNDEIFARGHSGDPAVAGMGSTLVFAVLRQTPQGREAVVANAGDSRAYLIHDGRLRQLTKDHTAVQRMVDAGILTEENARNHPNASVLTRALGQQNGTSVEVYPPVSLAPGDGLLLCSDGLSGYAGDPEIARVIASSPDPNTVVRGLIELALQSGSDDNITVQFLRLGGSEVGLPAYRTGPANVPPQSSAERLAVPAMAPPPAMAPMSAIAPPPATDRYPVVRRNKTSRFIAIGILVVVATLAYPVGKLVKDWWQTRPGPTPAVPKSATDKPPKHPEHDTRGRETTPTKTGQGTDPAAPPPQAQGPAPAQAPPTIDIHTPASHPGWIDVLKKKLGEAYPQEFSDQEIAPFRPTKKGIRVSFRKGLEQEYERIAKVIGEIPELKQAQLERSPQEAKDMPPGVDALIVAAPDLYQRR